MLRHYRASGQAMVAHLGCTVSNESDCAPPVRGLHSHGASLCKSLQALQRCPAAHPPLAGSPPGLWAPSARILWRCKAVQGRFPVDTDNLLHFFGSYWRLGSAGR